MRALTAGHSRHTLARNSQEPAIATDRWQRAKDLFEAALHRDPRSWGAFLDEACPDDPRLRAEVEGLLRSYQEAPEFLVDTPPADLGSIEAAPALQPGARVGPYEVIGLIGTGGMGQVYRARDSRLGREVAVKVLPAELTDSPERVRRFEQEARAASALNHPNILTVHDVGAAEGGPYLVTELLEGHPLRDVLRRDRLSLSRALGYAQQVARGLAAAHERGIVHRDLKPENLFVTRDGLVKILDFGLARLLLPEAWPGSPGGSTHSLTGQGIVLGTVGYMSPEQVRGEPADTRSDVFAFGAVLYELLCGQQAFRRATAVETMNQILNDEPVPVTSLRPDVPPAVQRVLERCLAKAPEERFGSGREALFALDVATMPSAATPALGPGTPPGRARPSLPLLAMAALGALAGAAAVWLVARPGRAVEPAARLPLVASIVLPPEVGSPYWVYDNPEFALSPDGSRLVYVGVGRDRRRALWVRDLAAPAARELPGTALASSPFWSPDGGSIGFFAEDKLKKVRADAGPVQSLCTVSVRSHPAGSWSREGVILFSDGRSLYRVPALGGTAETVAEPDGSDDLFFRFPRFLPDGRRFLYYARRRGRQHLVYLGSLDGSPARAVHHGHSRVEYSADAGQLLFVREGVLMAQAVDAGSLQAAGEPVPLATGVANHPGNGRASFSVSERGHLAYAEAASLGTELVWRDRLGAQTERLTGEGRHLGAVLSPDGRRVAVEMQDEETSLHRIWILGPGKGVRTAFSRPPHDSHHPAWSPDGRQIAFTSSRSGKWLVYRARTDGLGEDVLLHDRLEITFLAARQWTGDAQGVMAAAIERDGRERIWFLPVDPAGEPRPLVDGVWSALSPSGRWVAVSSFEGGRLQVYVLPYPGLDTRWQVSAGGGNWPRWRSDGRELFYVSEDRHLMSVDVGPGEAFESGPARALFPLPLRTGDLSNHQPHEYDVAPGGDRFVLCQVREHQPPPSFTIVADWGRLARPR